MEERKVSQKLLNKGLKGCKNILSWEKAIHSSAQRVWTNLRYSPPQAKLLL